MKARDWIDFLFSAKVVDRATLAFWLLFGFGIATDRTLAAVCAA